MFWTNNNLLTNQIKYLSKLRKHGVMLAHYSTLVWIKTSLLLFASHLCCASSIWRAPLPAIDTNSFCSQIDPLQNRGGRQVFKPNWSKSLDVLKISCPSFYFLLISNKQCRLNTHGKCLCSHVSKIYHGLKESLECLQQAHHQPKVAQKTYGRG